jgi:hypothetical protein
MMLRVVAAAGVVLVPEMMNPAKQLIASLYVGKTRVVLYGFAAVTLSTF